MEMAHSFIVIAYLLPVSAFLSTYQINTEIPHVNNITAAVNYCQSNGGQLPIFKSTNEATHFIEYRKFDELDFLIMTKFTEFEFIVSEKMAYR